MTSTEVEGASLETSTQSDSNFPFVELHIFTWAKVLYVFVFSCYSFLNLFVVDNVTKLPV